MGKPKMSKAKAGTEKSRRKVEDLNMLSAKTKDPDNDSHQSRITITEENITTERKSIRESSKKKISKECEETVHLAVSDFFDTAWMACAERFFLSAVPVCVSVELRNTWLRIVEAEYQDYGIRGKTLSDKLNRVFKSDEPPLPLAFDTWSRGALEPFPHDRRESIMDPFLRDLDVFRQTSMANRTIPNVTTSSMIVENPSDLILTTAEDETKEKSLEQLLRKPEITSTSDFLGAANVKPFVMDTEGGETVDLAIIPQGDTWDFALDQDQPQELVGVSSLAVTSSPSSNQSNSSEPLSSTGVYHNNITKQNKIHTLFSAWPFSKEESNTDIEFVGSRSKAKYGLSGPKLAGQYSGNDCERKPPLEKLRLPLDTSSLNVVRTKMSAESELVDNSSLEHHNVKVDREEVGKDSKFEVHPLFEDLDRDRKQPSSVDNTHRLQDTRRRHPGSAYDLQGESLSKMASDMGKRFAKRRLFNLHARFKRQALRSLVARVKRNEVERSSRMTPSEDEEEEEEEADSVSSSINTSTTKSDRRRTSSKKSNSQKSLSHKSISYSVSALSVQSKLATGESQVYFVSRNSAKVTSSEPKLLNDDKKKELQKENKLSLRNVGIKANSVTTRENLRSPYRFTTKDKTQSPRNIGAAGKIRSTMGNVRPLHKDDFPTSAGKFDGTRQFQYRFENKRKDPTESIELKGRRKPPNQPSDHPSTVSTCSCSINASLERLR